MGREYYKIVYRRTGETKKVFPEGTPFAEVNTYYNALEMRVQLEFVVLKITEEEIK